MSIQQFEVNLFLERLRADAITDQDRKFASDVEFALKKFLEDFDNVSKPAVCEKREITDAEFREYLDKHYIAYKLWSRADIESELLQYDYSDCAENVDDVLNAGIGALYDCTDQDWQIIHDAIFYAAQNHDLALSNDVIERALNQIRSYYNEEEIGPDNMDSMTNAELFPDIRDIGLAFTHLQLCDVFDEDEIEKYGVQNVDANAEFAVQVSLDLQGRCVTTTFDGVVVKTDSFNSPYRLLSWLEESLDFNGLVSFFYEPEDVKDKIAYAMKLREAANES